MEVNPSKPRVSIIIVNYNTLALTIACIESVIKFTTCAYETIVVDNASPDRNIEALQAQFPGVNLILNEKNLGFGAANNIGIAKASGEYILLLNSDTLLISDAVQTFLDFMELPGHQHIAGCGGSLVDAKGAQQVAYGNFPTLTEIIAAFGPKALYANYYDRKLSVASKVKYTTPQAVDYISGAALFLRKTVLEEVGVFDEEFFLYFEETELAFRIWNKGYALYILPEVKIVHLERSSTYPGGNKAKDKIFEESRLLFFNKCYGQTSALLVKSIFNLHKFTKSFKQRKATA